MDKEYYNIHIQPNLFGEVSIIKSWGSIVNSRRGHKITLCESESEVIEVIKQVTHRQKPRKYKNVKAKPFFLQILYLSLHNQAITKYLSKNALSDL